MNNKDEYIVYVRNDGMRFYCKNTSFHREAGPAVVRGIDNDKYDSLDKHLYKEINRPYRDWPYIKLKEYENLYANVVFSTSCGPNYYLNGISYSKEDFEKIILKNKLEKELPYSQKQVKKLKI